MVFPNGKLQWPSFLLRLLWHFGMLLARILTILLFTVIFGTWTTLPLGERKINTPFNFPSRNFNFIVLMKIFILGLHWIAMTVWIIIQDTNFCPNKLEETLYNVVMGFVYCFCYINLREGHTRYRLLIYYTLMITQNFGSLFLYVLITDSEKQSKLWSVTSTTCIITGTFIGNNHYSFISNMFYLNLFYDKIEDFKQYSGDSLLSSGFNNLFLQEYVP